METKKITIVGNGQIGQAIIYLLRKTETKNIIEIYDRDEIKNKSHKTLKECLNDSNFIFICVPSWCLKDTLDEIRKNNINPNAILISLSKGIDTSSHESVNEMIERHIKKIKYALFSGPMLAKEILKNKKSFAVVASKDKKVFNKISELFKNTELHLEYSKEIKSIAFSAVLKNIYALAICIIDSSKEDNNLKGFLSAKAVKEMQQIMKILKLNKEVILGTSGLGDFFATVSSEYSQNKKAGIEISTNGSTLLKSEGLISLSPLIARIGKKHKELPILCLLKEIVIEKKDPKTEIEKFLKKI